MHNRLDYLQAFFNQTTDMYWVRGADFKTLLYVSPACTYVLGVSADTLYQNSFAWLDKLHQEDKQKIQEEIASFIEHPLTKTSRCYAYRIMGDQGNVKKIHDTSYPLYDEHGHLFGFAGTARDVTQEGKYLKEEERASYYFHIFTERFRAAFWVYDGSDGTQVYLSPGFEKIWGRTREALYQDPTLWLKCLHPDDYELGRHIINDQLQGRGIHLNEYERHYRIIMPDGETRWIKDTCFPIHEGSNMFIGFAEDISKEILYQQELQEARQRAEAANQAKSDFLAMVSHELRTPLNAIVGMSQILQTKPLSDELHEYVTIIQNAGGVLLSLVNDMLDFARLEAGRLTFDSVSFDLRTLLEQIVLSMQYLAREKPINLTISFEEDFNTVVMGDPDRIRQILVNLIGNAIKFTDEGFVRVNVTHECEMENKKIFHITVSDSGIGIPADKLKIIFNRFSQIDTIYKRKQGGIGLGLSICKELIIAMGGDITVQSEFGVGSTFKCVLPLPLSKQERISEVMKVKDKTSLHLPRFYRNILMVEDNLINQKIATHMLKDFGCKVTVMSNGREVFEDTYRLGQYDIIFMDIGLPDMNGFEIASRLREMDDLKHIPIIAMTAHVLDRDKEEALRSGMKRMIAKPIGYEVLREVLESYS